MNLYYILRFVLLLIFAVIFARILLSFHHAIPISPPPIKEHEEDVILIQPKITTELYYTVLIDPNFTSTEVRIIREALNEWQYTTNGFVSFRPIIGYVAPPLKRMKNDTIYKTIAVKPMLATAPLVILVDSVITGGGQVDAGIVGYFDHNNMTKQPYLTLYIVRERVDSEEEYRTIVLHEWCHAAEMQHLKDIGTILYPSEAGSSTCITIPDLKYMCSLYGCDAETMNPCYDPRHPLVCSDDTFHLLYQ